MQIDVVAGPKKEDPQFNSHEMDTINRRSALLIITISIVIFAQIALSVGFTFFAIHNVDESRKQEQQNTWSRFLHDRFKTLITFQSGYAEWSDIAYSIKNNGGLSEQEKEDWLSGNADKIDLTAIIVKDKIVISGGLQHEKTSYLLKDKRIGQYYKDYSMKPIGDHQQLIIVNEPDFSLLMVVGPIADNSAVPVTDGIELFAFLLDNEKLAAVDTYLNAKTKFVSLDEEASLPEPYLRFELIDSLHPQNIRILHVDPNINLFSLVFYPLATSILLQLIITAGIILSFHYLMKAITKLYRFVTAAGNEIVRVNKEMAKDLEMAKRIQQGILPNIPGLGLQEFLNIDSQYVALATLGGDLYDLIRLGRDYLGILMADVSGHGVPAALITAMVKVAFHNHARWSEPPSDTCYKVNNELYKLINDHGYYLTAYYGVLNLRTGEFQYSNAGHHPALLIKHDTTEIQSLDVKQGLFIGIQENTQYSVGSTTLEAGDRLLLFTDGIIEARNPHDEFFEYERLHEFIHTNSRLNVDAFTQKLLHDVEVFSQHPVPDDDQAVMLIEYLGNHQSTNGQQTDKTSNQQADGATQEIVVLFSDLRGFTAYAGQHLPHDVLSLLNQYLKDMGRIIEENSGRIDKFIGDGIMAIFGLNEDMNAASLNALNAAHQMKEQLEKMNALLIGKLKIPFQLRIGIHAGTAIVGELGYGERLHVTALGDVVAIASQLEDANKKLDTWLLVSDTVAEMTGESSFSADINARIRLRHGQNVLDVQGYKSR